MKKIMLILAAACMSAATNAKILRVSNVSGSSAPYSTIEAAHDAARAGDTIMVDASNTSYTAAYFTNIDLTKRVVVIGPGYDLVQNEIVEEGACGAAVGNFTIKAEGTVIKGMTLSSITISAPKAIINRCKIGTISFNKGADNAIISQNYITELIMGSNVAFCQVTNNIFAYTISNTYTNIIEELDQSYIAYNTFRSSYVNMNANNSTIEHNLCIGIRDNGNNNSINNNYDTNIISTQATNDFIDKDYLALEIPENVVNTYGAFAGDSPYILSGIPSGPVIQDLVVPTTVERGSKLNVTVKIGMVK